MQSVFKVLFAFMLAVSFLWQSEAFRDEKSITFDETVYLRGGLEFYWKGRFRVLNANGISPLPVIASYSLPGFSTRPDGRGFPTEFPSWGYDGDRPLIESARSLAVLIFGLPLVLGVYAWLLRRDGLAAAATGGALMAFSPTILAHGSLATTDACLAATILLAVAALAHYSRQPSIGSRIATGVAIGAVISAKYSGLIVLAIAGYTIARTRWWRCRLSDGRPDLKSFARRSLADLLGVGAVAFFILLLCHGFDFEGLRTGVRFQMLHAMEGHGAYLLGRVSGTGWWHYYPVAFLVKSTPSELALFAVLIGLGLKRLLQRTGRTPDVAFELWCLTIAIWLAATLFSTIDIGHRYLVVIYPFIVLAGVDVLYRGLRGRPRYFVGIAACLVFAQISSAALSAPHWLAYFNRLAGGSERGHTLLLDSNLDWGQDLPGLARTLEAMKCRKPLVHVFGTAKISEYGIEADHYDPEATEFGGYGCFAVSANNLFGLYRDDSRLWPLRHLAPVAKAGHSIWIYDLSDPVIALALDAAR